MGDGTGVHALRRCLLVLLAVTGGVAALLGLLLPDLGTLVSAGRGGALRAVAFDFVVVRIAELALAGCAVWLWATTVVVTADAVRGRSRARRGVPDGMRRLVVVACGLALAGGLATPAQAEEPESGQRSGRHLVEGLPLPDRATTTMHVSGVFARAAALHRRTSWGGLWRDVVVRPGDTLWELARRDLPRAADDQAVAERVRVIHTVNRAVIGADPDLIRPGQRLRLPRT
jgi:hypothetical protein